MSNMLIDDRPIMFLPMLAKALGSCERAIVLQQIHWLLQQPNSGIWEDGLHWVWGTYEEWCNDYFPMWSPHTLKKHILKLERDGLLISAKLRAHKHDQTKFYRINYRHELLNVPDVVSSNVPNDTASNVPDYVPSKQPHSVVSIYRTETSSKTSQKDLRPSRAPKGKYSEHPDPEPRRSYNPEDYDLR